MLLAPKGTSKEITEALHNAIKVTLADPGTQSRLDQIGIVRPAATGADYARQFLQSEVANGVRFFVKRRTSARSLCRDKRPRWVRCSSPLRYAIRHLLGCLQPSNSE